MEVNKEMQIGINVSPNAVADPELSLYAEALSRLQETLEEGQKTSNIDVQMMWLNIIRCRQIIQQLSASENDTFYSGILLQLETSLASHVDVLQKKISQLNSDIQAGHVKYPTSLPSCGGDAASAGRPETQKPSCDDSQKQQRRIAIEDTIITKGGLTFQDIAGLHEAKQALREAIIMPLHFPHLFTGAIKPWRRILLYGPPGTGKSRLAQAISSEINSSFYCVSSSDLVSSWVGESEKLIKELFQHATTHEGRSVIFIDEIDSISRQRNSREEEHTRRIKTELLKQMEGADNSDKADKIFLLCATNCPWELDSAFLRRFQKRIYIPLPDKQARIELMKIHTKGNKLDFTKEEWRVLGVNTEGYSGSDIANMMLEALFRPIRDLHTSKFWKQQPDGSFVPVDEGSEGAMEASITDLPPDKVITRNVALSDFMMSVETHRKTVTAKELNKFEDFTKLMGESG
ncbi:vacuolar protein sorting-associated protein 4-like [Mizuhopecten yessoensis]|uniref:vacuolar protein sorting-associated protein 4-like n=1 Tax=Mizuhopecten yessoensis TaxID=6573 RepID=UPI000B457B48|nr:vacuolar protein sorting-associated protein 4-like [Mizuhopecten yessoensis]